MDTFRVKTALDALTIREKIEEFASEMWAVDSDTGRVDWEEWADRFEQRHPEIDLGSDMTASGFVSVQKIARDAIREARHG